MNEHYLYLACLDHDPPLLSEPIGNSRRRSDVEAAPKYVAERDDLAAAWAKGLQPINGGRCRAAEFLAQHPKCRINVVNGAEIVERRRRLLPDEAYGGSALADWELALLGS